MSRHLNLLQNAFSSITDPERRGWLLLRIGLDDALAI
jgi:hypothetical protein